MGPQCINGVGSNLVEEKQVIDRFFLCVYDRVCKVPGVLLKHLCLRTKADFFVQSFKFQSLFVWYGAAKINHTGKVASCLHA